MGKAAAHASEAGRKGAGQVDKKDHLNGRLETRIRGTEDSIGSNLCRGAVRPAPPLSKTLCRQGCEAKAIREYADVEPTTSLPAGDHRTGTPHRTRRDSRERPAQKQKEFTHGQRSTQSSRRLGTPISPAFEKPEDLARWLADSKASAFGSMTATYEEWLVTINSGFAPSMVLAGDGTIMSGVQAGATKKRTAV